MPDASMRRVCVFGNGGSGKSVVSRAIGEIAGLPVVHLDLIHWRAGWDPMPADDFVLAVDDALDGERWVCDGNHGSTVDLRLSRADTVVLLDLSAALCIGRVVLRHGKPRPDLPEGCLERRLSLDLFRFAWWVATHWRERRRRILARIERYPHLRVHHLRTRREVSAFLADLRATLQT